MRGLIYTYSFLLILFSCKTAEEVKSVSNINVDNKRYAVGKGGGFTGAYDEYILNEDGKVYKYDFKYDREIFFKELSKADLVYLLEKIETLSLDGIEINQPGNISYYIDVRIGKASINKIVWGANLYYAPNNLIEFHKELFTKLSERE